MVRDILKLLSSNVKLLIKFCLPYFGVTVMDTLQQYHKTYVTKEYRLCLDRKSALATLGFLYYSPLHLMGSADNDNLFKLFFDLNMSFSLQKYFTKHKLKFHNRDRVVCIFSRWTPCIKFWKFWRNLLNFHSLYFYLS